MKTDVQSPADRRLSEALQASRMRSARISSAVFATQLALLAAALALWEYATQSNSQTAFMFGSPSAIFGHLVQMFRDNSIWRDSYVTGLETVLGFIIGNVIGTALGLALWYSRFVSRVV